MDDNRWGQPKIEDFSAQDRVRSSIDEDEKLKRSKSKSPEMSKKDVSEDKSIDAHRDTINNTGDDANSKQTDADAATG